jgi:enoyl-CoA hydratase
MPDRVDPGQEAAAEVPDARIVVTLKGAAGCVVLDRPERRNALTIGMRGALGAVYPQLARDPMIYAAVLRSAVPGVFSAGADLRELAELARGDPAALRRAVAEILGLCWQHECFSKPTVSLMDGLVLGGGAGISLFGTHRVAGERYALACPEIALGIAPSNGLCHALARMPGSIGVYLALTGETIGRAEALRLGLVTHCIAGEHFDEIERRLSDADPVDPILDALHRDPGPDRLAALEPLIGHCFSAASVEDILARLRAAGDDGSAWAREAAAGLLGRSPLALKATHRLIGAAARLDLRAALQLDYRVTCRLLEGSDFQAGVRVALGGEPNSPAWQPATLDAVGDDIVAALLADDPGLGLALPSRAQMQRI